MNRNYAWFKRRPSRRVFHFGKLDPIKTLCGQPVVRVHLETVHYTDQTAPPDDQKCPGCAWRFNLVLDAVFGPQP